MRDDQLARLNGGCMKAFGRPVTYQPAAGAPVAIRGIFDDAHQATKVGLHVPVSSTGPTLRVTLSDLASEPVQGDHVEINGTTTYEITDVRPDGSGMALLVLVR